MSRVNASIPVLRWAFQRAGLSDEEVEKRFKFWPQWLKGEVQPTLKQLEGFARLTRTSFGYFFLAEPPRLELPVPDFRTVRDEILAEPSTNLLDTIYLCQQRQDWYRQHARMQGMEALTFVGSANQRQLPHDVANEMRSVLGLPIGQRLLASNWQDALRQMIAGAEQAGIMVMVNSMVGSYQKRKLDVGEFRGFALSDSLAPLVFINGADSKSAQMFTLAHELAHLWLDATGVSNAGVADPAEKRTERWCNQVAAEFLVPMAALREQHRSGAPAAEEMQRLSRVFKVSTLVALRRLHDAGFIDQKALWRHYHEEEQRLKTLKQKKTSNGGSYYNTLGVRVGRRFARAIISSALEGTTSFTEAHRLLGVKAASTFNRAAKEFGVLT